MSAFCLTKDAVEKFKKGLVAGVREGGELHPDKLSRLSSEDRHSLLEKYVGKDNATQVNALFESKLLLKNQKAGYLAWAKKVGGLTKEAKRDLISRIERLDKVLNPAEEKAFLQDLASTKLGTNITQVEAKQVFDLSQKIQDLKAGMSEDFKFKSNQERLAYGRARVNLANYVNDVKGNNRLTLKSIADVGGLSKSIRASMDNSAIFRQGFKTLTTNPIVWAKNAVKTFSDLARTVGGKEVLDEVMSDRESRPNELNGNYKKMGLAVSKAEEAFPTSIPEKIPALGRLYKASENAYTGFVYRLRMDLADKYIQIAEKSGVELNPKELESIGSMVNSLTGRGNFGKYEGSLVNATNNVFFSPRNLKSQFDTLGHIFTGAGGSSFVRKQAAINLVKTASAIYAINRIANAVMPGSAETDPRSSDFGNIKVGNTRFNYTGGMNSLVTLGARLAPILAGQTPMTKSTVTGELTPINSDKFGAKSGHDVVDDFFTNKYSPITQVINDVLNQKDRDGNKLSVQGELENLTFPLSVSTFKDLQKDPKGPNIVLAMIADGLGIATNTYTNQKKVKTIDWSESTGKELTQFKQKVGEGKFKAANEKYNTQVKSWQEKIVNSSSFKKLSKDEQDNLITQGKAKIQTNILKSYGFKYKQAKKTSEQKRNIKNLLPK